MPSSPLSRAIAAIRPVAILGPVLIHARLHAAPTPAEHFFATVLGDCAVPLLFFLSGLLFFRKESWERRLPACDAAGKMPAPPGADEPSALRHRLRTLDFGLWTSKLRRRVRSLLVPYLAWNLLAYLLGAFVFGTIARGDFLPSFWSVRVAGRAGFAPADGPTYFLKTLMELALVAPVFPLVNRHGATAWGSPALALLWCVSPVALRGHTERAIVVGLVFFNLGAWAALREGPRAALQRLSALFGAVIALALFAALAVAQCVRPGSLPLHRATILASLPAAIALGGLLARAGLPVSGAASRAMFLFGAFDLLLPPLRATLIPRLGSGPAAYLALAAAVVAVSALCHEALRRLCPAALRILTGGRDAR